MEALLKVMITFISIVTYIAIVHLSCMHVANNKINDVMFIMFVTIFLLQLSDKHEPIDTVTISRCVL